MTPTNSQTPKSDVMEAQNVVQMFEDNIESEDDCFDNFEYLIEFIQQRDATIRQSEKAKVKELVESVKSVLCDPDGEPCFAGSDGDRKVIKDGLAKFQTSKGV